MRIVRILHAYPHQTFVLLGDDSQMDPDIYSSVIDHFPGLIKSVYLRHVHKTNRERVQQIVDKIMREACLVVILNIAGTRLSIRSQSD